MGHYSHPSQWCDFGMSQISSRTWLYTCKIYCWVYACTKVNPYEFLSLILLFMVLFYCSILLILLFWFISMSLHFSYIFLYFIFFYSRIYSRRGTLYLLPLRGYACAPTFQSELTTRRVFASTHHDSFASAIPTRLHPLDVGLSNTFPRIVGGVETRADYDLIGKSWPRARYMCSEPRNTVSLSSVLDHHWGVIYLDCFLKLSKLPLPVHPS